jgi:hypothetical protein
MYEHQNLLSDVALHQLLELQQHAGGLLAIFASRDQLRIRLLVRYEISREERFVSSSVVSVFDVRKCVTEQTSTQHL